MLPEINHLEAELPYLSSSAFTLSDLTLTIEHREIGSTGKI